MKLQLRLFESFNYSLYCSYIGELFYILLTQTIIYRYFEAIPEGKPSQRHLYKVPDNVNSTAGWECLTCPPNGPQKNASKMNNPMSSDIR